MPPASYVTLNSSLSQCKGSFILVVDLLLTVLCRYIWQLMLFHNASHNINPLPCVLQLRGGWDGFLRHGAGWSIEEVPGPHSCPGRSPEGGTTYWGLQVKNLFPTCGSELHPNSSWTAAMITSGITPIPDDSYLLTLSKQTVPMEHSRRLEHSALSDEEKLPFTGSETSRTGETAGVWCIEGDVCKLLRLSLWKQPGKTGWYLSKNIVQTASSSSCLPRTQLTEI